MTLRMSSGTRFRRPLPKLAMTVKSDKARDRSAERKLFAFLRKPFRLPHRAVLAPLPPDPIMRLIFAGLAGINRAEFFERAKYFFVALGRLIEIRPAPQILGGLPDRRVVGGDQRRPDRSLVFLDIGAEEADEFMLTGQSPLMRRAIRVYRVVPVDDGDLGMLVLAPGVDDVPGLEPGFLELAVLHLLIQGAVDVDGFPI